MHTLWTETARKGAYPALDESLRVDVAVVGGGIAGLTAALQLQRGGRSVALLEAQEIGSGETGRTSAHLTAVQDARFHEIASRFGREAARRMARHGMDCIDFVEREIAEHGIDCDFARVPGWLYAERREDLPELERELDAARAAGMPASFVADVPLPYPTAGAVRFERQAIFHPLRYVHGLARALVRAGGRVHEHTRVRVVDDGKPCRVRTERGSTVEARDVVVATDSPVSSRVFLHAKLTPMRTYLVQLRAPEPLPGLFWDTGEPYHYLRSHTGEGGTWILVGGEDHKVGELEDTDACLDRLEAWVGAHLGFEVERCWSGQVNEPADGLPYVGRNALSQHVWVATGFSGTGLVNGTLAGRMLADEIAGRRHPLAATLQATRVHPTAAAKELVSHNADAARHFLKDWVAPAEVGSVDEIGRGEGRIARVDGRRLAVYRDDDGALHALSPVCTHLGCHVHFNAGEKTWDCPCHGSRYGVDGEVIHGPATKALARHELPRLIGPGHAAPEGEHAP